MNKVQQDIVLADHTTFKIGGPAEYFREVQTKQELLEAYQWARDNGRSVILLGGGSNVLISDRGVKGLVIKPTNTEVTIHGDRVYAGAGAPLGRAVRVAAGAGLSGLEWAGGIPGATMGGATRGNAGAFGVDMSLLTETVEVFDMKADSSSCFPNFSNKDCSFDYRTSIFKKQDNYIVWHVILKLRRSTPSPVKEYTGEIIEKRKSRQPNLPNAGCIFKNLSYDEVAEKNPDLLAHAESVGAVNNGKIGAGWVIDLLGLRGKIVGGAKISLEHANFIVNTGRATSVDVVSLISHIKKEAKEKLGLELREEIQYLGFDIDQDTAGMG